MAKELPYFKFYTSEWLDGDITLEDYKTQGLFINLCALYWSKEGDLYLNKMKKRFRILPNECFENLINEELIAINNEGKIEIAFLDEQMTERVTKSQKNSINGKKGGRPKLQTVKPNKKQSPEENNDLKAEKFNKFWDIYNKKQGKKKCLTKFLKLKDSDILKIAETIENYIKSTPDIKFRKDPYTYLNGEHWNDEIKKEPKVISYRSKFTTIDKVIELFNETDFNKTIKKYKSSEERVKERLDEFLEKEVFKADFKNRPTDEVLSHFINSLQFNPPKKVIIIDENPVVPWLSK